MKKGLKTVIEELKQTLHAETANVRRYQQRMKEFRRIRIFDFVQKKIEYAEFNGDGVIPSNIPNAEECNKFWGDSWRVENEHNQEAE